MLQDKIKKKTKQNQTERKYKKVFQIFCLVCFPPETHQNIVRSNERRGDMMRQMKAQKQ